ncbi:Protein fam183bp [Clonorchis sinensis]|uniref:Protein fam183bp n=1 Tax=Clonorchis sinensis TaxID=79923 RepID=A0A8T1M478_CLOSI|nr:Protein fam183bp [Clonorchis sinensis]
MTTNASREVNFVHQAEIMTETIKKELRHQKLYTQYGINPFKKLCPLASKPNAEQREEEEDKHFLEVLNRAALEPTKKYLESETENQEYGWISLPLMDMDRSDARFYHPNVACEMTKFMEQMWKQKEQRRLNA